MADAVPEGQVPRGAAFWRTFHAVEDERAAGHERALRLACHHSRVSFRRGTDWECNDCGADRPEVLDGYRRQGLTVTETDECVTVSTG